MNRTISYLWLTIGLLPVPIFQASTAGAETAVVDAASPVRSQVTVFLDATGVKDPTAVFGQLATLTRLRKLCISKRDLKNWRDSSPELEDLYDTRIRLAAGTLPFDDKQAVIREVYLVNLEVTDAALSGVPEMKDLEELHLSYSLVSDAAMDKLQGLSKLRILDLTSARITDAGIEKLLVLTGLEELYVSGNPVTSLGMASLGKMAHLQRLSVGGRQVNDDTLVHLKNLKALEELTLAGSGITNEGLAQIAECKTIRRLDLSRSTGFDDDGVKHLQGLPELEMLDLRGTGVSDVALAHVANLPRLRDLRLSETTVTDKGLEVIGKLVRLEELHLAQTGITDAGFQSLENLAALRTLSVFRTALGDKGLASLSKLTGLEKLLVGDTGITDAGMESIGALTALKVLGLNNDKITDAGVAPLSGLKNLEDLRLAGTRVGDGAMAVVSGLPHIKRIQLDETAVTDKGVAAIEKLGTLMSVSLVSTGVSDVGLEQLRNALPVANISPFPMILRDEFDSRFALDWQIWNVDLSKISLARQPGMLTITTQDGSLHDNRRNYHNLLLTENPFKEDKDFAVTTCIVGFNPTANYHQAGLICLNDEDNFIKWVCQWRQEPDGKAFAMIQETAGRRTSANYVAGLPAAERIWLRLSKHGDVYEYSTSSDGANFQTHGQATWTDRCPRFVGLMAIDVTVEAQELDASFDFFEVRERFFKRVDRYTIPDGGPEELVKFIENLRNFRPMSLEQYQQHRAKAAPAIRKAAERILESVDAPKSPMYRTAKRVILQDDAATLGNADPARQMQVFEETTAFLAAMPESKPDRSDLSLAMTVARGLESTRNRQLASKAYTRFGELFAASPDALVAQAGRQFLGAARRLDLLGNEMKLEGKLLDGSDFQWEAYRGKVVLVDYWATWCGPCRAEVPNVKKNYEKYHERGFEVVGISLDTQRQAVEKYLKEQEIPWATLYQDGAGWSHPAAVYYGVSAIPTVILVNREGKVVSLQARGPELGRLLEEIIGAGDSP